MGFRLTSRDVPGRFVTGAFILHAGIDKWSGPPEVAGAVHGMASGAYPFLGSIPAEKFLKLLAASEIVTGTALLAPFVSNKVAGAALTGFAASLLGLYWRTPGMRKPGSVWPTQNGTAVSKDVWMLGIGVGLLRSDAD
jgi:hypothetical protein